VTVIAIPPRAVAAGARRAVVAGGVAGFAVVAGGVAGDVAGGDAGFCVVAGGGAGLAVAGAVGLGAGAGWPCAAVSRADITMPVAATTRLNSRAFRMWSLQQKSS
jgi:hypothetical protein